MLTASITVQASAGNVEITLAGAGKETRLSIPVEYISFPASLSAAQHHHEQTLLLEAMLPDFAPLPPATRGGINATDQTALETVMSSGNFMSINLSQGSRAGTAAMIQDSMNNQWVPIDETRDFPGFHVFEDRWAQRGHDSDLIKIRYLLPQNPEWQGKVYMECPINKRASSSRLYCKIHTDFDHLMYGNYTVAVSRLSEWENLDRMVRAFIAILTIDNSAAE